MDLDSASAPRGAGASFSGVLVFGVALSPDMFPAEQRRGALGSILDQVSLRRTLP